MCNPRPCETIPIERVERSGQKKVDEDFTEAILQNPLFLDLDPTIQGLPWVLRAVFLTRETG
jgi:hypothetical protein